jgi:hypothetical protein
MQVKTKLNILRRVPDSFASARFTTTLTLR